MAGFGYSLRQWAGLTSEQVTALQQAQLRVMQAVDSAKTQAERGLASGVAQVREVVDKQLKPDSPSFAHSHWGRRPSRNLPGKHLTLRVCTWNLHGSKIDEEDNLAEWLLPQSPADLYVVGIQELVELGPMSMLLNTAGHEERQQLLEERVEKVLASSGRNFLKVCSFGMVGLSLLVYVSEDLQDCIGEIDCDRVKTGVEGLGGNKGGVCVRFLCASMSMCFVNVHLPSGSGKAEERSEHLGEILSYAFQGISRNGSTRAPKKGFHRASVYRAAKHDLAVVFGDMNSRLVDQDDGVPPGPAEAWLLCDELICGKLKVVRTLGFRESEVTFPPTYKYQVGSDELNPQRCPAWCDRVIFRHEVSANEVAQRVLQEGQAEVEVMDYDSYALKKTSDHRPVAALFRVSLPEL